MKKRIVVAVILGLLAAASALAQKSLVAVAMFGTPQDVQAALEKGADVSERGFHGMTPLIAAAAFNQNPEVILLLLKAGADIEARDSEYGSTALVWAAFSNQNQEATSTLLKAGADAKVKDNSGKTAFDYARYKPTLKGTDALQKLEEASQ